MGSRETDSIDDDQFLMGQGAEKVPRPPVQQVVVEVDEKTETS
jgi:hypothetical protein